MKKSNVRKTISEDGWKELTKIALCGPKEIRRWKAFFPAGKSKSGLPVGLQIVGPRFAEPGILALAKLVQEQHPIGRPSET